MSESCSSSPTEFRSLTRRVVESFLQTVVVLDDFAEMPGAREEPTERAVSDRFTSPEFPQAPAPVDDEVNRAPQGVPLNAKSVIDGFAEIGAVCAVLKANPDDKFQERTIRTARRADIVILDWTIYDSTGEKALSVMHKILEEDSSSQRLRLIAVYTGEPDLGSIYNDVRDQIDKFYKKEDLIETDGLRITKGPLNVVVLAKAGVLGAYSELAKQEVNEEKLASRLVDEFADMAGGLIRNVAIAGIAGIRDNAHRILAEFDANRDSAYLGHRLLLAHPPDAEDHLEEALGSEVASVLEEHRSGTRADIGAIQSWLIYRQSDGLNLSEPFPFEGNQDPVEGWLQLLEQGIEAQDVIMPKGVGKKRLPAKSTIPFAKDAEAAQRSDILFAALLKLKTCCLVSSPRLSIGTILHAQENDQDSYLLCLQPKCDSVRLRDSTGFPFLLLVSPAPKGTNKEMSFLVVPCEQNAWKHLAIVPKPSKLTIRYFQPEDNPPGEVCAKHKNKRFFFEDSEKRQYRWIAQMKDEHALGVASQVATSLARPGPNEAEWLRRGFPKPT